jgi:MFS family permease
MPSELRSPRELTSLEHSSLALLWFAYNLQWGALLPVVLPAQVAAIAGQSHKELVNGWTMAAGGLVALVTAPVAGALSDRSVNPRGRRRGFLIFGIVLNIVSLALLGFIGTSGGLAAFVAALLVTQFACNWWGGPYAGLIPDVVPPNEQGRASGYMMLMTVAGTIVGTAASGPLLDKSGYAGVYLFVILALAVSAAITLAVEREPRPERFRTKVPWRELVNSFFPDLGRHRDFYVVLVSRALVTMGAFSTLPFLQYFFTDVMHDPKAIVHGSILLGSVAVATLPVSLLAGRHADRVGPKSIVWVSGWVMAAAAALYAIDCFIPSWFFTIVMALIFGAASVAYQTVDWALALNVLPNSQDHPGKDMGIWHVSFVLPQAIAPVIAGALLDRAKHSSEAAAYGLVFLMAACWYALGTLPIRKLSDR